ncbi:thiol-disulfide oxidoreductase DCC family protein [Paenibacillus sp. FJAT-26967]|uniref:thiol-disulfide oxidoreductase DCC family protein n=1 Tax=Paenibacillus sp. FJAT-26967 TaxID=1729690 RepID=UPI000839A4BE|nr:thiol-disulfide oxidoreductase DCC family protein [Paenibacillus sp. FJAT-26967]
MKHSYQRKQTISSTPIILLIDGQCSLCHAITRFVIRRDPGMRFRFASIQSAAGQKLLARCGLSQNDLDTFVMVKDDNSYIKSDAALRVFKELRGMWPLLYGGIIFPLLLRDKVYDVIAQGRYRWFGRNEACMLLTEEHKQRFLEDEPGEAAGFEKKTDLR